MTFQLMKSSSIKMFSHRQNANIGDKDEPKYDDIPEHLSDFYTKAVADLKGDKMPSGTEVTNDLAGHLGSGKVTPMAVLAIMNPMTGKYQVETLGIITPADAAELEAVRQLFKAPKPKRKKKGSAAAEGGPETPPSSPPPHDEPPASAEAPPPAEPPASAEAPPEAPPPAEPESKGTTKLTEMLGGDDDDENLDDVLNAAAADEPKSEAAAELEAATEARADAEDDEEDPDLAAIFGDDD